MTLPRFGANRNRCGVNGEMVIMRVIRTIALGTTVATVALGAGHMVQTRAGTDAVERARSAPAPWEAHAVPRNIVTLSAGPAIPGEPVPDLAPPTLEPVAVPDCTSDLKVTAAPGALLDVALTAPCDGGVRVVLRHGGLAVTARLPETGYMSVILPALDGAGEVVAVLADGDRLTAAAPVDLSAVERFAVQWSDADAFQLHVYEDGAAHGQPGHVSAADPGRALPLVPGRGGYLLTLGDAGVDLPLMAEVYTFPADPSRRVAVTIEAAVTPTTCGRETLGETLHSRNGTATVAEILLAMPGCDAVGDFLVLNNLLPQPTLAQAR